jgi:hypothetical protein
VSFNSSSAAPSAVDGHLGVFLNALQMAIDSPLPLSEEEVTRVFPGVCSAECEVVRVAMLELISSPVGADLVHSAWQICVRGQTTGYGMQRLSFFVGHGGGDRYNLDNAGDGGESSLTEKWLGWVRARPLYCVIWELFCAGMMAHIR